MSGSRHIGFFSEERDLMDAIRECMEREIRVEDVVTPYPIHGIDDILGIPRSRLPWVTLVGGALGLGLGFWLEYWTSAVNWPLNVGGKPLDSLPAFVPVAFELTILVAGLGTAGFLLARSGLWPGRPAAPGLESTTDDRFALILEECDARVRTEDYAELLLRHGAAELRYEWDGQS